MSKGQTCVHEHDELNQTRSPHHPKHPQLLIQLTLSRTASIRFYLKVQLFKVRSLRWKKTFVIMAIIINNGDRHRYRQMNNIRGLISLAVLFFVAGIVMAIMTGIPAIGGSICTAAVILAVLGFVLLVKYKGSAVTVFGFGGGQTSTTVTSSSMMTQSLQEQHIVRRSSHSHSVVNMRQSSSTNVRRSSSVAHIHDQGVLGWGDARPSAQPVDNGWMGNGSQTLDGYRQQHPPPPHPPPNRAVQPGMMSQPGGYTQPGGFTQGPGVPQQSTQQPRAGPPPGGYTPQPGGYTQQPGNYTQQPGGYTQPGGFTSPAGHPSSSSAGGFTNPSGPGPSSYNDAPPSYDDAVRLQGKT